MFLPEPHFNALSDRVHQALSKLRHTTPGSGEKPFGEIMKSIETVGVASTMGYLNTKHCKPGRNAIEFGGVPADLTFGVLGNVVALSGYLGTYSEHAHNLANGFLCAYGVRMGMMWGADARAQRANAQAIATKGALPEGQPSNVQQFTKQPRYDWAA